MREIIVGSKGQYTALVDDCDYAYLIQFRWTFKISQPRYRSKPYARRTVWGADGVNHPLYMHHVILDRMAARKQTPDETADHADKNTLNNTRDNLSYKDKSAQNKNRHLQKWSERHAARENEISSRSFRF